MAKKPVIATREEWLNAAAQQLRVGVFDPAGAGPYPERLRMACGFPGGGSARSRIGECWHAKSSAEDAVNLFVSPVLDDAKRVLDVLAHELIHAIVGPGHGHKGPFRKLALAIGLTGKMTATVAGPELAKELQNIAKRLGPYPHGKLGLSERKKQTTRMRKCTCAECGYVARTTAKWINDAGPPLCPCNGEQMSLEGAPLK